MAAHLHDLTAALYLLACLVASLDLALPAPRLGRVSLGLFAAAIVAHGASFALLHTADPTPPLTDLPFAISFMLWVGAIFCLLLARRGRLAGLIVVMAPLACIGVFIAGLRLPKAPLAAKEAGGSWAHAHVLLASAGLALLGVAFLAGLLFLLEHHRLKSKRPISRRFRLPSLEALDRVNAVTLAVGFPLLTVGVVTGMLWVEQEHGRLLTGAAHQTWSIVAWAVYAVLLWVRFTARQGSRQAAAGAVLGFLFLFVAAIGLELFR